TLGDINGIGPEVVIKALSDSRILNYCTPVIYGSTKTLSYYRKNYKIDEFQYTHSKDNSSFIERKINVVNCWDEILEITAGTPTEQSAWASRRALEKAISDIKEKRIDAVVTGPINKHTIQSDTFKFPGHTEYLTSEFGVKESLMLMVSENMRVGVVTGHIPLKEVTKNLNAENVRKKIDILEKSLKKDFGIQKPRIAILGINPHNGDKGLIGTEEEDFLIQLVSDFREENRLVFGPFPADGFFGGGNYSKYDAILAMYHDQGLIPFKTLSFGKGINFTAGLPIIRTSPDHGTAYSIAGQDIANPSSMREAIFQAIDLCKKKNS
ncbi:MAG: 4-hydroxythreonine-4-phosphate dehydrogenase PdxA, partial [Cyclobacteriaceae bacterium]|nr:4-hydroxythreonine-4-phosphate dehydrogenase PdxA [Cyclobacteriaceae bacterium]